mgnify:CR=1 FL=1
MASKENRLRKLIMWSLVQETGKDVCFRCGQRIETIDELSIDHKEAWRSSEDPEEAFLDPTNIAFSHLRCNTTAPRRERTHCPQGHEYTEDNIYWHSNGWRHCRTCQLERMRNRRALVPA